jgi:uncharacterized protein (DUF2225 family)
MYNTSSSLYTWNWKLVVKKSNKKNIKNWKISWTYYFLKKITPRNVFNLLLFVYSEEHIFANHASIIWCHTVSKCIKFRSSARTDTKYPTYSLLWTHRSENLYWVVLHSCKRSWVGPTGYDPKQKVTH